MFRKRLIVVTLHSKTLYVLMVALVSGLGIWMLREPAIWTNLPMSSLVSGKKVVIDAGHGGGDPGAKSSTGVIEKNINLDVALRLKKYLSRVGVYCVMTRQEDRDFFDENTGSSSKKLRDLCYRAQVANRSGADIFLSIHANSFPQRIYYGAQTFFNPRNRLSKKLAYAIQYSLVKALGPNRRRPKAGDFRVINDTRMPGVMIEIGFLSNPDEAERLNDSNYRDRIAEAVYHGILAYFTNQITKFSELD